MSIVQEKFGESGGGSIHHSVYKDLTTGTKTLTDLVVGKEYTIWSLFAWANTGYPNGANMTAVSGMSNLTQLDASAIHSGSGTNKGYIMAAKYTFTATDTTATYTTQRTECNQCILEWDE